MTIQKLTEEIFEKSFSRESLEKLLRKEICTKNEALQILNLEAECEGHSYTMDEFEKCLKEQRKISETLKSE